MESFGCKVHVSDTPDIENYPAVKMNMSSSTKETTVGSEDIYAEKKDLSVSIAVTADDNVPENSTNRICESLCPLWARDAGCRWPDADCAQLRSQFIGLKANYDAFDRLTIDDSYFQPE